MKKYNNQHLKLAINVAHKAHSFVKSKKLKGAVFYLAKRAYKEKKCDLNILRFNMQSWLFEFLSNR